MSWKKYLIGATLNLSADTGGGRGVWRFGYAILFNYLRILGRGV
jgi:hypothetical protein